MTLAIRKIQNTDTLDMVRVLDAIRDMANHIEALEAKVEGLETWVETLEADLYK